jgi:Protein of unknown function (DUF2752)
MTHLTTRSCDHRPPGPGPQRHVRYHLLLLAGCLTVLALSCVMTSHDRQVFLGPSPSLQLPELCIFHIVTGCDCPFCGLTRSFIDLGHGRVRRSFAHHRLGPLVFLIVVLQVPYRLASALRPTLTATPTWRAWRQWLVPTLFTLALINWVVGLAFGI